jgi:hypothetical protein
MAVRFWLLRAAAVGLTAWAATTIDDARATQRLGALASAPQAVATSPTGHSVALTAADVLDRALVVRLARPGRPFGALRLIPASVSRPGRRSPSDPRVAIGAGGRALVLWRSFDQSLPAPPFSRSEDCCDRLSAAVLDEAGRRLGPARRLSGTVRRVLGSFPPRTSVGVAATAAGHMLLVGRREEGPDPYFTLRIAYRRGGGRLRFTNVRVPGGNLQPFAVAVSSSGQALLPATGRVTRRLQRAFAWRMRLDGHGARRVTLLRDLSGGLPGGLGTGIDHAGRGIVAWGRGASLFARRVR